MADTNVPAWLMPIQKTKATMKMPHIAGRRWPPRPMPVPMIAPQAPNRQITSSTVSTPVQIQKLRVVCVMA